MNFLKSIAMTIVDFETTGIASHGTISKGGVSRYPNEPWQVGWVSFVDGHVMRETQKSAYLKIDASRPFNKFAPGRHSQIRDVLHESPSLADLWPEISKALLGVTLVAHNVATERGILAKAFPLHRFGPWVDTLTLSRKAWPGLASYALEDLLERFGLSGRVAESCPGQAPHDALYDAVGAGVLLEHLLAQPGWDVLRVEDALCSN